MKNDGCCKGIWAQSAVLLPTLLLSACALFPAKERKAVEAFPQPAARQAPEPVEAKPPPPVERTEQPPTKRRRNFEED